MYLKPQGGGGRTLIFSYIRRLRLFFGGSKFRISIFFLGGGGPKNEYFLGYEDFFWGVITKLD